MTTQLNLCRKGIGRDDLTMMPVMLIDSCWKAVRSTPRCSNCSENPDARAYEDEDRHRSTVDWVLKNMACG